MQPTVFRACATQPKPQSMLLFEAFKRCVSFRRRSLSAARVAIAELEEAEVALLMVDVVCDGLQAAEE